MKMYIYSHNPHSEGAKALSQALNVKRIKHGNSKFRGGMGKVVINWGSGRLPDQVMACSRIINSPNAIINASNKLKSFELFKEAEVSIPPFFTDYDEAADWMVVKDVDIVCRTTLNGHSGAGIVIAENVDELVQAPLYTVYVKKQEEYRYHVFMGQVVDIQRKARKRDVPDDAVNWKVRNLDGGFIFAREGVVASPVASEEAVKAVAALGLDFGAVDLIYNAREDKYYVLEVNTAPGLAGTTLEGYKQRFEEVFNG